MARATRSRGAVAKPTKKSAPAKPATVKKPTKAAPKKRSGGNSKSVRRALGDISNKESDAEDELEMDEVASPIDDDVPSPKSKRGRGKVEVEPDVSDDEDEGAMSEESEDESDYEETAKKSTKGKKAKKSPKSAPPKKTAGKKTGKKEQTKPPKKTAVPRSKAAAVPSKTKIFEDVLEEEPIDKDFSNLAGFPRMTEETMEEDDLGGGDWRCFGAVDY